MMTRLMSQSQSIRSIVARDSPLPVWASARIAATRSGSSDSKVRISIDQRHVGDPLAAFGGTVGVMVRRERQPADVDQGIRPALFGGALIAVDVCGGDLGGDGGVDDVAAFAVQEPVAHDAAQEWGGVQPPLFVDRLVVGGAAVHVDRVGDELHLVA